MRGSGSAAEQTSPQHNQKASTEATESNNEAKFRSKDTPTNMNQGESTGRLARKKWNTVKLRIVFPQTGAVSAGVNNCPRYLSNQLQVFNNLSHHVDFEDDRIANRERLLHFLDVAEHNETFTGAHQDWKMDLHENKPTWYRETLMASSLKEISPKLATFEQVRAHMAGREQDADEYHCKYCGDWGCDRCKPDWFDKLLGAEAEKGCMCIGWDICFAGTMHCLHQDDDVACDSAWGGCGNCAKWCAPRFSGDAVPAQPFQDVG
jgi:hypothetical protein